MSRRQMGKNDYICVKGKKTEQEGYLVKFRQDFYGVSFQRTVAIERD